MPITLQTEEEAYTPLSLRRHYPPLSTSRDKDRDVNINQPQINLAMVWDNAHYYLLTPLQPTARPSPISQPVIAHPSHRQHVSSLSSYSPFVTTTSVCVARLSFSFFAHHVHSPVHSLPSLSPGQLPSQSSMMCLLTISSPSLVGAFLCQLSCHMPFTILYLPMPFSLLEIDTPL
jgi:hypothetical protein